VPADDPAGKPGRSLSADRCGFAAAVHASFFVDFFLYLDFADELTDVHKGPWELASPRRLKPRRGAISPPRRSERNRTQLPYLPLQFRSELNLLGLLENYPWLAKAAIVFLGWVKSGEQTQVIFAERRSQNLYLPANRFRQRNRSQLHAP
jgi:hypothetical protein